MKNNKGNKERQSTKQIKLRKMESKEKNTNRQCNKVIKERVIKL